VADPKQVSQLRTVLAGLRQEEADRRMAGRLEAIHIRTHEDQFNRTLPLTGDDAKDTFAAAFRDYGIPVQELEVEEAARRVRESALKEELIAALDDWAGVGPASSGGRGNEFSQKLVRIARRVVDDPWRQKYFDARLLKDDNLAVQALIELARQPKAPEQEPFTVSMLARYLRRAEPETSIRLLERAQLRYPGHLLINYELAETLSQRDASGQSRNSLGALARAQVRSKKAIVCYRIALALRPDNRHLLQTMAGKLTEATEFDEAIACYRECYRLMPGATNFLLMIGATHREKRDWDGAIAVYRELLAKQPRERRAYWGIGMALCEKGVFHEAIPVFEEAIRREPLTSEPHAGLGLALEGMNRLDEALKAYKEAIRLDKEPWRPALIFPAPDAVLGMLHVLQKQKVPDPVRATLQEAFRLLPARGPGWNPGALMVAETIAEEMTLKGDVDAVIAAYQEAEKLQPGCLTGDSQLQLADALLVKDRLDEAIRGLETVAKPGSYNHAAFFKLGAALVRKGQWEKAEKPVKQAIRLLPWEPTYHYLLGNILAQQRKLDEAVDSFRQAIRWNSTFAQAYGRLAMTLAEQGKLDEAVAVYRDLLSFYTNPPDAHRNLGVILARQGKLDEAVAAYRITVRYSPKDSLGHYFLGNALAEQDKLDDALTSYREAIRLQPDLAEAHAAVKSTLARREKPDEVLAALRETVRLQPKDAQAAYRLGNTLARLDKLDEAVAAYRTALRLKPDDGLIFDDLGRALTRQDKLDDAVAACRDAVRLLPDDMQVRYGLAYALSRQGTLDEAVAAFREVVRRKPEFVEAYGNLGVALFRQGKLEEAVVAYRRAIQLRPDDAVSYHNLAQALFQQDKFDESLAASREALRLQPNEALAHSSLAAALLRQERVAEAVAACHEALRRRPDLAEAHITLASALPQVKALNEFIAKQRQVLSERPDDPAAFSNLAVSLIKAGKFDEAIQIRSGAAGAQQLADALSVSPLLGRAISDCQQLLRRRPKDVSGRFFLGIALYRRGSRDEANALFSEWINQEPKNRELLIARGQLNRRDGARRESALADLARATDLDPSDATTWALRADLESEAYRFPEAEEHYSRAIKLKPEFAPYWSARGFLFVRQRQWDNVVADYSKALELLPRPNPDYLTMRGDAYVKLEQWDRAVADYVQATKAFPNYYRPWDRHIELHALRGEWDKAIAVCAEGAEKTRYLPLRTRLAWLLATCPDAKQRDPARAIQIVKETPKLLPGYAITPDDWAVLGAAHYRAGDWKAALEALTKAVGTGQGAPSPQWFFLAMTHHHLGNRDEARKAYDRTVEGMAGVVSWVEYAPVKYEELRRFGAEAEELLGPSAEDLAALMTRGRASWQIGQWAHALADFSRATEVAPRVAEAWNWRGLTQLRLKQWDKAVADFSQALELSPKSAAYRNARGDAYAGKEEWDKALADYTEVLANKEDVSQAVNAGMARANLHAHLGQWDKALADYTEFIQKMPQQVYFWKTKQAWLLAVCPDAKVRDSGRALKILLKEVPDYYPPAVTALGAAQYREGDFKAAVATLTRAVELDKGAGSASFFLAMAHKQLGQKDEARKWYDRAVAWMDKNQSNDKELRRFRAEAAEVLGLEKIPR
jgi:tetratricopeptide (TPR) repeat protein